MGVGARLGACFFCFWGFGGFMGFGLLGSLMGVLGFLGVLGLLDSGCWVCGFGRSCWHLDVG